MLHLESDTLVVYLCLELVPKAELTQGCTLELEITSVGNLTLFGLLALFFFSLQNYQPFFLLTYSTSYGFLRA